jgi:sugar-specific transcriptional regulator TrmB
MTGDDARGSRWLPALLCVAAAVVVWTLADDQRAKLPSLVQQLKTAQGLLDRMQGDGSAAAEATARGLRDQRQAWQQRLASTDNEAVARAQAVHTLRQACIDALATQCTVRLSDEVAARGPAVPATGNAAGTAATLDALGIRKARAVVSGAFQTQELETLVAALQNDPRHHWRINGLQVRGNAFDLDVERHFIEQR